MVLVAWVSSVSTGDVSWENDIRNTLCFPVIQSDRNSKDY